MSLSKRSVIHIAVIILVGAGFFSTGGTPAFAESWSIKSGQNIGVLLPAESRKLSDGSTYVSGGSKQLVVTEDSSYPITGQSMECRWICKIDDDGADGACVTMCAGVDEDGDLFSFRALSFGPGKYEVGPGTGKYEGATGGGTFEAGPVDDPALSYVVWKGTLKLK